MTLHTPVDDYNSALDALKNSMVIRAYQRAWGAAANAAVAKRQATLAREAWQRISTGTEVDLWGESLKATKAWRTAQAETHAANAALLDMLGLDWRNHL